MKHLMLVTLLLGIVVTNGLGYAAGTDSQGEYPNLKFTGFARARYTWDLTPGKVDGFSIAQARFGITGDISKFFTYTFSIEGTNADTENRKMVYDVYIETSIVKNFKIRVGQFKYAFGLEQTTPDADLEFINKAEVVNNLIKPTRDIGIQVAREFVFDKVRSNLTLGLVNGSGSNIEDENNRKTWVGRLTVTPIKGLTLGASFYDGTTGVADKKTRAGAELRFDYKKFTLKAEYISGKDKTVKKDGYYAMLGYTVLPSTVLLVRYDNWDTNRSLVDRDISRWTVAVNYFFGKNILWRNNYEHRIEKPGIKNDLVMTQIQVKW
ncbi:MAG: porin [Candidatus Omnitrophota bacterium]